MSFFPLPVKSTKNTMLLRQERAFVLSQKRKVNVQPKGCRVLWLQITLASVRRKCDVPTGPLDPAESNVLTFRPPTSPTR